MYCQYTFVYCQKLLCIPNTQPIAICFEKGVSYMWPFCNHILGLLYVEIAKIVETWKLVEKIVSRWGFQPGPISHLQSSLLCQPSTAPPSPSVAIFFIYRTRIWFIWIHNIRQLYEFIAHRRYEFIHFNVWILFWRRDWRHFTHGSSYEFIGGTSHTNTAYHYCPVTN